jgi:hypothetical protein
MSTRRPLKVVKKVTFSLIWNILTMCVRKEIRVPKRGSRLLRKRAAVKLWRMMLIC